METPTKKVYVQTIKIYSTSIGDLHEVKHEIQNVKDVTVEYGPIEKVKTEKVNK